MKSNKLIEKLNDEKLLPLYTVYDIDLLPIAERLLVKNGLNFIEITYRSELASQSIELLSDSGKLIVGAGTVTNLQCTKEAISKGAQFIVTPGISLEIIDYCIKQGIPVFPGAVTPSEIMTAINKGITNIKFFPASIFGGLSAIQNLSGPFANVKFLPTGGVSTSNYLDYISDENVLAVGGSFILTEKMIKEYGENETSKHLEKITSKI